MYKTLLMVSAAIMVIYTIFIIFVKQLATTDSILITILLFQLLKLISDMREGQGG